MGDLVWSSVVDLARMIATKEVSPVEVTRAFLERVAALDGALKSFITVSSESCHPICVNSTSAETAATISGVTSGTSMRMLALPAQRLRARTSIAANSVPTAAKPSVPLSTIAASQNG